MNPNAIDPWTPSPELIAAIDRLEYDLRLPTAGRAYIDAALKGPARQVEGRMGNVCVLFPSPKLGTTLFLESRRGELQLAIDRERDKNVLAYMAQPPSIDLKRHDADGKIKSRGKYTPDMLTLRKDAVIISEVRDETRLYKLQEKDARQFHRDLDGTWHDTAAEAYFGSLGFKFEIHCIDRFPVRLNENLRFLEDYLRPSAPQPQPEALASVCKDVTQHQCIAIRDLLDRGHSADAIFHAITRDVVHVNLHEDRLADTMGLLIFTDAQTRWAHKELAAKSMEPPMPIPGAHEFRAGSTIEYSQRKFTVIVPGERELVVHDDQGHQTTLNRELVHRALDAGDLHAEQSRSRRDPRALADFDPAAIQRGAEAVKMLRGEIAPTVSQRTLNRYRQRTAHSGNPLDQMLALADRRQDRGNRQSRFSEQHLQFLEASVHQLFNQPYRPTKKGAYAKYAEACLGQAEASGQTMEPVSYPTFCRYCDHFLNVKAREGRRSAYQSKRLISSLNNAYPVHGVRPHEVVHIDHTTADLALVLPGGSAAGKATLSIAVDAHTTQTRAMLLHFDPPSAQVVLMLLRDYVRRHHRLPRVLVLDNGREFHSHELEFFCRTMQIEIRFRPPAQARAGSPVERRFGAINEEVLSEMDGNTRFMKTSVREITKSVDPFRRSQWTLHAAYRAIEQYLFIHHPQQSSEALNATPLEYEQQRLNETGHRDFMTFKYDESFILLTCPFAARPMHKVHKSRGVWVNGIYYQHPDLRNVHTNEKVAVRVEPWCASVIYVEVNKRWVAATGSHSRWLCDRTSREIEIALAAERRQARLAAQRDRTSPERLRYRSKQWTAEDFDPRLSALQKEMRSLYEELNMGVAMVLPEEIQAAIKARSAHADGIVSSTTDSDILVPLLTATSKTDVTDVPSMPLPKTAGKASQLFQGTGGFC